jgi:hypothetical protein
VARIERSEIRQGRADPTSRVARGRKVSAIALSIFYRGFIDPRYSSLLRCSLATASACRARRPAQLRMIDVIPADRDDGTERKRDETGIGRYAGPA